MSLSPRKFERRECKISKQKIYIAAQTAFNKNPFTGDLTPRSQKRKIFSDAINILRIPPQLRTEEHIEFLTVALESNIQALKKLLAEKTEENMIGKLLREFRCGFIKQGDKIITIDAMGEEMYILLSGHIEVLTKDPDPLYLPFEDEEALLNYRDEDEAMFYNATPTDKIIPSRTKEGTHELLPQMTVYEVHALKSVFNTDKPGFIFGQDSLLQGKPRNATIRALDDCYLATLKKPQFDLLIGKEMEKQVMEKIKFMKGFILFQLQRRFLEKYHQSLKDTVYRKGDVIYREFEPANTLYFIERGEFSIEKTIFRQPRPHGRTEIYAIANPETMEKISLVFDDPKSKGNQMLVDYDGKTLGHHSYKKKSVLHTYLLGDNSMFGIEDTINGIRKRIFTVRCMSETAKVWRISRNEYRKYFYRSQPIAKEVDEVARSRLKFLLTRIQESLASKVEMIDYIDKRTQLIQLKVRESAERGERGESPERCSSCSMERSGIGGIPGVTDRGMVYAKGIAHTTRDYERPTVRPPHNITDLDVKTWDITQSVPIHILPPSTATRKEKVRHRKSSLLSNALESARLNHIRPMQVHPEGSCKVQQCPMTAKTTRISTSNNNTQPRILIDGSQPGFIHHLRGLTEGSLDGRISTCDQYITTPVTSFFQFPNTLTTTDQQQIETPNPFVFKYRRIIKNMRKDDNFYITHMQKNMKKRIMTPGISIEAMGNMGSLRSSGSLPSLRVEKVKKGINVGLGKQTIDEKQIFMDSTLLEHEKYVDNYNVPPNTKESVRTGISNTTKESSDHPDDLLEYYGSLKDNYGYKGSQQSKSNLIGAKGAKLQHLQQYSLRKSASVHTLGKVGGILDEKSKDGKHKGRLLRSTKHNMFRMISYPRFRFHKKGCCNE